MASLAKWLMFIDKLSGCEFESRCCHLENICWRKLEYLHVRLSKELAIINITNFAMVKFANVCYRSHIKVTTGGFYLWTFYIECSYLTHVRRWQFKPIPWLLESVIHNNSRVRHPCSLKLFSKLKYVNLKTLYFLK